MAKAKAESVDDIRPQYNFSKGVRGRYSDRIRKGSTVVVLEPDVAELYPDAESVNRALRAVAEAAPRPRKCKHA
ncbi:MAG: hypothetical protein IPG45_28080 [Deltaproteobacteria bacterium]|nr:hypothetical protein [Deltaproteobacteria bacterium]